MYRKIAVISIALATLVSTGQASIGLDGSLPPFKDLPVDVAKLPVDVQLVFSQGTQPVLVIHAGFAPRPGDPYPGSTNNTAFDSAGTNPNSRTNAGAYTGCGVNQIPVSADLMTPFMYIGPGAGPSPALGWTLMKPVPAEPSGKKVKHGGSLTTAYDTLIFCLKGNNTNDFYSYYVKDTTRWNIKESVPYAAKPKRVKHGAALVWGSDSFLYATKGNNTKEWLRYNIFLNTWQHKKPIPSTKGLKGGTGLAKVKKNGVDCFFLLAGSNTKENFLYYPAYDSWERLPDAPQALKGFKKGSCAAGFGDSIVYVLKDKENLFYRVNIQTGTWTLKDTLPLYGRSGKKKKVKEGAALAADDSVTFYAFKGGNTQEFWVYNVPSDTWIESETLPRGPNNKRIKSGGALTFVPKWWSKGRGEGEIYALKGSNTDEFWMYETTASPKLFAGQSEISVTNNRSTKLRIVPNPCKGYLTINYNIKPMTLVSIKIYNIAGSLIRETDVNAENDQIKLNLQDLSQGVYILRLENGIKHSSEKLIIQR
jgi:hypothetical protein